MAFDMDKVDKVCEYIDNNIDELHNQMSTPDWLHVVWALFTQHGYDVNRMFRYNFEPEKFVNRDFEKEMRSLFGGREDMTF